MRLLPRFPSKTRGFHSRRPLQPVLAPAPVGVFDGAMSTDASWLASMPARYDSCLGPALFSPYAEHVAGLVRGWAPSRVLEVAAGTGIGTRALVAALPDAHLDATDLNAAMVEWGAAHVPGASWRAADAQELDVEPGSYDLVVCQFGAMFFPDRPGAYAQMAAALAPGGRVVLTVWDTVDGSDLTAAVVACLDEALPDDPPTFIARVPHGYGDPDRITADLVAGGLVDVEVERVVLRGAPTVPAVFAEGLCLGTPLRFELQQRGEPAELARDLARRMSERLGSEPVAGALAAFVVTARSPG